jgi:hypothetical protein
VMCAPLQESALTTTAVLSLGAVIDVDRPSVEASCAESEGRLSGGAESRDTESSPDKREQISQSFNLAPNNNPSVF